MTVEIEGDRIELEPADLLVDLVRLPGYAAAQSPRATVILDTSLTPELLQEGYARDFVRGIQDSRKRAGYRVEDTIEVTYLADPEIADAIESHRAYVMAETLATALAGRVAIGASDAVEPELTEGPGGAVTAGGAYADQIEVGDHHVRVALRPTDGR